MPRHFIFIFFQKETKMTKIMVKTSAGISIKIGKHQFHPDFTYSIFGESEEAELESDEESSLLVTIDPFGKNSITGSRTLKAKVEPFVQSFSRVPTYQTIKSCILNEFALIHIWDPESVHAFYKGATRFLSQAFIEGAVDLGGLPDPRWRIYALLKDTDLTAYCTCYDFPVIGKSDAIRTRLSQFVVLPPWQGRGLGLAFYRELMGELRSNTQVLEVTIEDPIEAFNTLRLLGDYLDSQALPAESLKLPAAQAARLKWLRKGGSSGWDECRLDFKRFLCRKHGLERVPIEERKRVLAELYQEEVRVFERVLKHRLRMLALE